MAPATETETATTGLVARGFARAVVALRYVVVPGWIAAAVAATLALPGIGSGEPIDLGGLVPRDSNAVRAAERSAELFRFPLVSDTVVVQRERDGLSAEAQRRVFTRAAAAAAAPRSSGDDGAVAFALPVVNTVEVFPAARERATTALTFLFFQGGSLADRVTVAREYAASIDRPEDGLIGVTGPGPARYAQFQAILDALVIVEVATVALIFLVVAFTFRAPGAALLTLLAAGIAFLVAGPLIAWTGGQLGIPVPHEVEPMVVALTLGIVTDYTVFFLARTRRLLGDGVPRVEASTRAASEVAPIVMTAGLIVAAGTGALVVGDLQFFRAFGPGLALTAAISLLVVVTLVPAALALVGRLVFWPRLGLDAGRRRADEGGEGVSPLREAATDFVLSRPVSLLVVAVLTGALAAAATGVFDTTLGFRLVRGLPADAEERAAADEAARGFAPGMLAPTVILLEGAAAGREREALDRLEDELVRQEGVAAVVGPRAEEALEAAAGDDVGDIFVTADGTAARFAVVLEDGPLSAPAIDDLRRLDARLPSLLRRTGLEDAEARLSGQTAIASDTVSAIAASSKRVGVVVLAVNFVLLALFLRALVAPVYLLAASVLSVAATLGVTTYLFRGAFGHSELEYFVPFAAGVLLVSLGSDYNVYVVGRIWQEARLRPLREAIAYAAPRASRAISIAGLALALSFAMLAVVPLDSFRAFAFMMCLGIAIEAFLVRPFLIPALMSLFGRTSAWPGRLEPRATRPLAGARRPPSRRRR